MRILEWILVIVTIINAAVMLIAPKRRAVRIGTLSALALAILLHGVIDHFRVQLLPTYIVALVLLIGLAIQLLNSRRRMQNTQKTKRRSWFKTILASIMVLALSAGSIVLTSFFLRSRCLSQQVHSP